MVYDLYIKALKLPLNAQEKFIRSKTEDPLILAKVLQLLLNDSTDFTLSNHLISESNLYQQQLEAKIGDHISVYELVEDLGKGGMGAVFKAKRIDGTFDQIVAIKIISPLLYESFDSKKLVNEANFMAKLNHNNICSVYDAGVSAGGLHYIVMEYIDGIEISCYFNNDSVSLHHKLSTFADLCGAINYAHQMQVIHGDLKPANILISNNQRIKILDFGISQVISSAQVGFNPETKNIFQGLSNGFSSPELFNGCKPTIYSDIYALGCILSCIIKNIDTKKIPYINELQSIIDKAMALLVSDRYASALALKQDIDQYLSGHVVSAYAVNALYKIRKFTFRRHPIAAISSLIFITSLTVLTTNLFIQYQHLEKEKKQLDLMLEKFSLVLDLDYDKKSNIELSLANNYESRGEQIKSRTLYSKIINRFDSLNKTDVAFQAGAKLLISFVNSKEFDLITPTLKPLSDKIGFIANSDLPISADQAFFYHLWVNASYNRDSHDINSTFIKHTQLLNKIKDAYWQAYSNKEREYLQFSLDIKPETETNNTIYTTFYYLQKKYEFLSTAASFLNSIASHLLDEPNDYLPNMKKFVSFLQTSPIFVHLTHYDNVESQSILRAEFLLGTIKTRGTEGIYRIEQNKLFSNFGEGDESESLLYLGPFFSLSATDELGDLIIMSHQNYLDESTQQLWVADTLLNKTWYHIYDRSLTEDEPIIPTLMRMQFNTETVVLSIGNEVKEIPWHIDGDFLNLDFSSNKSLLLSFSKNAEDENIIVMRNKTSTVFSILTSNQRLAEYIYTDWLVVSQHQ